MSSRPGGLGLCATAGPVRDRRGLCATAGPVRDRRGLRHHRGAWGSAPSRGLWIGPLRHRGASAPPRGWASAPPRGVGALCHRGACARPAGPLRHRRVGPPAPRIRHGVGPLRHRGACARPAGPLPNRGAWGCGSEGMPTTVPVATAGVAEHFSRLRWEKEALSQLRSASILACSSSAGAASSILDVFLAMFCHGFCHVFCRVLLWSAMLSPCFCHVVLPGFCHVLAMFCHVFAMLFRHVVSPGFLPWFCHVLPCFRHVLAMVLPCCCHGFAMVLPCFAMCSPCSCQVFVMLLQLTTSHNSFRRCMPARVEVPSCSAHRRAPDLCVIAGLVAFRSWCARGPSRR